MNDAPAIIMVLAGGRGSRLSPLTTNRAKPAVQIGGRYRIIDFVLSNLVNSGYGHIYVLTQYMATSLSQHVTRAWQVRHVPSSIEVVPPPMRLDAHGYRGTADGVRQNLALLDQHRPRALGVFGGDHVYTMDVTAMERAHHASNADVTIAAIPVPTAQATELGVLVVDTDGRVRGFQEKPSTPAELPGRPGWSLASMGNYFFRPAALRVALAEQVEGARPDDFGRHVLPAMVAGGKAVYAYLFGEAAAPESAVRSAHYWRDVGSLDALFAANMELRLPVPTIDLYNPHWPIRGASGTFPPARFVATEGARCEVIDSLICEGTIVSGACISESVLAADCMVHKNAYVHKSVLHSGCNVGRNARLHNVIMDKHCSIDPGVVIGENAAQDRLRFPFVTPGGVVVLPKGTRVQRDGPLLLAADIAALLTADPQTDSQLRRVDGAWVSRSGGHTSYDRVGPRFQRFDRAPDDVG